MYSGLQDLVVLCSGYSGSGSGSRGWCMKLVNFEVFQLLDFFIWFVSGMRVVRNGYQYLFLLLLIGMYIVNLKFLL